MASSGIGNTKFDLGGPVTGSSDLNLKRGNFVLNDHQVINPSTTATPAAGCGRREDRGNWPLYA